MNDLSSLRGAVDREHRMAVRALAHELCEAKRLLPPTPNVLDLVAHCRKVLDRGPAAFDARGLTPHLIGQLSDLRQCANTAEQQSIAMALAFKLMVFSLRARGGWMDGGRHLGHSLETMAPGWVTSLSQALVLCLQEGDPTPLADLVEGEVRRHVGSASREWTRSFPKE